MCHKKRILVFIIGVLLPQFVGTQNQQKIDSLEFSLKFAVTNNEKIDALLCLSDLLSKSDPSAAVGYAKTAYSHAENENDENRMLSSLNSIAYCYWALTEYNQSMEYAVRAKELAEKIDSKEGLIHSLRTIGLIYFNLNVYDKSSSLFFNCLKISEQIKNKAEIALSLCNIGSVYFEQGNYDKALEYNFLSLNLAKETNDRETLAKSLNNIAASYIKLSDYQKGQQYFELALKINQELGRKRAEGINYLNLGVILRKQKKYDMALDYLRKAMGIFIDLDHNLFIARCQMGICDYFLELGDLDSCLLYATKAMEGGKTFENKRIISSSAGLFAKIFMRKGDSLNALRYELLDYKMKDSLNIEKSNTEIARLEMKYKFEKQEQEQKIRQQLRNHLYIVVIIVLIFSIILISQYLLSRQRIKARNAMFEKKQLENEIDYKNKELALNVMSLIKKNEIISAISDEIVQVKNEADNDETRELLKKIARKLKESTETEIWEEFEVRFKQVHGDFYIKLLNKFPNLSPSEQKLCAFLRLNMTTKEISGLTGQSINSLEMARFRLRKKLGISNTNINLISFLSQI